MVEVRAVVNVRYRDRDLGSTKRRGGARGQKVIGQVSLPAIREPSPPAPLNIHFSLFADIGSWPLTPLGH